MLTTRCLPAFWSLSRPNRDHLEGNMYHLNAEVGVLHMVGKQYVCQLCNVGGGGGTPTPPSPLHGLADSTFCMWLANSTFALRLYCWQAVRASFRRHYVAFESTFANMWPLARPTWFVWEAVRSVSEPTLAQGSPTKPRTGHSAGSM